MLSSLPCTTYMYIAAAVTWLGRDAQHINTSAHIHIDIDIDIDIHIYTHDLTTPYYTHALDRRTA